MESKICNFVQGYLHKVVRLGIYRLCKSLNLSAQGRRESILKNNILACCLSEVRTFYKSDIKGDKNV